MNYYTGTPVPSDVDNFSAAQDEENHGSHNKYDARSLPHSGIHRAPPAQSSAGSSRHDPNDRASHSPRGYLHHSHATVAGHSSQGQGRSGVAHSSTGTHNPHADSDSAVLHPKLATSTGKREKARQKLSSSLKNKAKTVAPDSRNMGHPYKIPVQIGGVQPDRFRILKIKAVIDKKPTTIDERSSAVLKYRTPHFR